MSEAVGLRSPKSLPDVNCFKVSERLYAERISAFKHKLDTDQGKLTKTLETLQASPHCKRAWNRLRCVTEKLQIQTEHNAKQLTNLEEFMKEPLDILNEWDAQNLIGDGFADRINTHAKNILDHHTAQVPTQAPFETRATSTTPANRHANNYTRRQFLLDRSTLN
jgi:hypothetical protein